jgi:chromosome segregation ATPase
LSYSNERTEPKVFLQRPTGKINQQVFYSNKVMESIRSKFSELEYILGTHGQVHESIFKQLNEQEAENKQVHESLSIQLDEQETMNKQVHENISKQLNEQETMNLELQSMHENLQREVEEKGEVQNRLQQRMDENEVERKNLEKKLVELVEEKNNLLGQLHTLEQSKSDLRAEVDDHNNRLRKQEVHYETMQEEQANQMQNHDELVLQVNLQKLDHEELMKKVKDNEQEQKQIHDRLHELVEQMNLLSLQQYEQESMHLDLFTQLIQLKSIHSETSQYMKESIEKLSTEIKKLEKRKTYTTEE